MKPDSVPPQPLSVKAKPFTPQNSAKTSPLIDFISSTPAVPSKETKPRQTTFNHENLQNPSGIQYDNLQNQTGIQYDSQCSSTDMSNFMIKKNLLLESFQQQRFGDRPDRYVVWKAQFKCMTLEFKCSPLEEIILLTNCTRTDSDAHRLVMSARASYTKDPKVCLDSIWDQLNLRFGSAEMLESALKTRIMKIPDHVDRRQLYELHDLLKEIEAVKNIDEYSLIFSYLDSSLGIRPIVQKLPRQIQEKWITRVVNYKKRHQVLFPPFSEFVAFIGETSVIRNDPGLIYDAPKETFQNRKPKSKPTRPVFSSRKTDVLSGTPINSRHPCLIHKNTKHTINECKAFRAKNIDDRKALIKSNNICLRCCDTSSHFANRCKMKLECDICKSERHCTALHVDSSYDSRSQHPARSHGEESQSNETTVETKCTEICGNFRGKSCARILPVRIFVAGKRHRSIEGYAMLDDQSNKTLGKSELFNNLSIKSEFVEYTMQSCSGKTVNSGRIAEGLVVEGIDKSVQLTLPQIIECDNIPDNQTEVPTANIARHYPHMNDIVEYMHDFDPSKKVLLLIGRDLPEAHHVLEQRTGPPRSPFAQRSPLGWTIIGDVCLAGQHMSTNNVYKTFVSDNGRPTMLEPCQQVVRIDKSTVNVFKIQVTKHNNIFQMTPDDNKPGLSIEDQEFLNVMDNEFRLSSEGKWIAPLPFRTEKERIPDNFGLALRRAKSLDASLHKNTQKKEHFLLFMQKIIDNRHAEPAPYLPPNRERWYLPLFGVYHPRKPDRIRGVFDSSAKFEGVCLNDQLMQGPDLMNSLLGILIRFRKEMVGVVGDIEQMFHSFLVRENHRDYLRFLWHKDNKLENPLITYRMCAHVFGNRPSPAIAMYGLRKIGELAEKTHGPEVKDFIANNFYVDDGLKSCASTEEAIDLLGKTQDAMKTYGNIRLHKFASNDKSVMESFDCEDLAKEIVDLDFEKDVPTQRSLGILWDLQTDTFKFSISTNDKPVTRRGILSVVNSLYDPLGFISPVTIKGKIILRKVVSSTTDWDEPLTGQVIDEWINWKTNLPELEKLRIPRVIVPNLSKTIHKELLIYCDASELAIAAACYLRVTYRDSSTSTGFVLGKAKVAPASGHTIPRLELCAAVLAVEVAQIANDHLQLELDNVKFFSDSRVVLGYINNEKKRFFVYVANRVALIRSYSNPSQWFYVRSEMNPADISTRGISASNMQDTSWLAGPSTLQKTLDSVQTCDSYDLVDPEIDKEVRVNKVDVKQESETKPMLSNERISRFSNFDKMIIGIVTIRKFIQRRCNSKSGKNLKQTYIELVRETERMVIRQVQHESYMEELKCLSQSKPLSKNSSIYRLDPFIDINGILRVGGRLKHSDLDLNLKNPMIIPARHHLSTLIVRKYHDEIKHQGRHLTEGRVRSAGYWLVGGKRLVSSVLHKCVTCRKLRQRLGSQKMSNLPEERVISCQPPFTFVGVDMFGPWEVVTRRTRGGSANSKRWAALFTCLSTRAVHIEVVEEMTASSFINALRRFCAIRGNVKTFRSDNGTNFVGAANELRLNVINIEDRPVQNFLNQNRTSWIFNPPHSSHMGGVWERMIGVIRRILNSMLLEYGTRSLTHEVLTTFLAEASAIINSRPLISISTDPEDPFILSPSVLLTQKTGSLDVFSDNFEQTDQNDLLRKQWKRVQHLASVFWKRWRVDYLNTLQNRRKWNSPQRNVSEGDVVMVRDKRTL